MIIPVYCLLVENIKEDIGKCIDGGIQMCDEKGLKILIKIKEKTNMQKRLE